MYSSSSSNYHGMTATRSFFLNNYRWQEKRQKQEKYFLCYVFRSCQFEKWIKSEDFVRCSGGAPSYVGGFVV